MKKASTATTTETPNLTFSTREGEHLKRLELKYRIASKTGDRVQAEKIANNIIEMEEFAEWRIKQLMEKDGLTEIKTNDLKRYTITKWRREIKGGLVIEKKSIKEEIELEIRRWRELELQDK